jgi:uncharacterized membrane protein YciS (DUF1049 family)
LDLQKKKIAHWPEGIKKDDALMLMLALGVLSMMVGLSNVFDSFETNVVASQALLGGLRVMCVTFLCGLLIAIVLIGGIYLLRRKALRMR